MTSNRAPGINSATARQSSGRAVAVGEPVELELPRLDGVARSADEQDVGSLADLLGPDVEVTDAYVLTHS
jgi:hypothetical protein